MQRLPEHDFADGAHDKAGWYCREQRAESADGVIERRRIAGEVVTLELLSGATHGFLEIDNRPGKRRGSKVSLLRQSPLAQHRLQRSRHGLRVRDVHEFEELGG